MAEKLLQQLAKFNAEKKFQGKGPLCVALVVTQHARKGLPLDPAKLRASSGGQVSGLGKAAVQSVLRRHGIDRVLAYEGGRTSRGSLRNMEDYVTLLNDLHRQGIADLDQIEKFWIDRVRDFFAAKPFRIRLDPSKGVRLVIRDVLAQAEERQRTSQGVYYAGAVMQHLVGAKLDCALGEGKFKHNSFSTADAPGERDGDFRIGDVVIHVTTSPGEAVVDRCQANLNDGLRPILVTTQRGLGVVEGLAANMNLQDRIDVFEIEQFIALNIYEIADFAASGRKTAVTDLVEKYNEIASLVETDPSLQIELRK